MRIALRLAAISIAVIATLGCAFLAFGLVTFIIPVTATDPAEVAAGELDFWVRLLFGCLALPVLIWGLVLLGWWRRWI